MPIRYTPVVSLLVSVSNVAADDQGLELGVLFALVQGVEKPVCPPMNGESDSIGIEIRP